MTPIVALLIRLVLNSPACAAAAGTDFDCAAQDAEDDYNRCADSLTSAACGDTCTAQDLAMDVCENLYVPGTPESVLYLCASALVSHRDAGLGFESLATEF